MSPETRVIVVQRLIWILIYGGLLTAVLGLFLRRSDGTLGAGFEIVGGAVALIGFGLIWVRSRMK